MKIVVTLQGPGREKRITICIEDAPGHEGALEGLGVLTEPVSFPIAPMLVTDVHLEGVSDEPRAARETCPRLLVGMGDDTYDPECCLPLGHSGRCQPEGAG